MVMNDVWWLVVAAGGERRRGGETSAKRARNGREIAGHLPWALSRIWRGSGANTRIIFSYRQLARRIASTHSDSALIGSTRSPRPIEYARPTMPPPPRLPRLPAMLLLAHPTRVMAPRLPVELWNMVIAYLDPASKKQLRLVDAELSRLMTPHLFETVSFNLDEGGIDRLTTIATSESLRPHVHTLVLRRTYGLNDFFDGFESWERCVIHEEPRHPELEDRLSDGSSVDDDSVADGNDVISAEEWFYLSDSERHDLFNEYERDRVSLREHTQQLLRGIYYKPLGSLLVREQSHARATNEELEGSLSNRLDEALPRLTQLRRFKHYPAYMMDRWWGTRWRRLRFQTTRLVLYSTDKEAERVENIQLSLAVRALGLAGEVNGSLRVLDIYVAEAAFFGAVNLGRL